MHPRQASLLSQAKEVMEKTATDKQAAAQTLMWKYTDPEGNVFYLLDKKMTLKSPYSGKSFSARPERFTPAQMVKDVKEDAGGGDKEAASTDDPWKS